jgi:hypothetical protein
MVMLQRHTFITQYDLRLIFYVFINTAWVWNLVSDIKRGTQRVSENRLLRRMFEPEMK